jgi:plasmid maintenance system antidote protein VapI
MYKSSENVLDRLASVLGLKTHRQLADLVGLKSVTIQSIKLGRRPLTENAAKQIEKTTGVSRKWLLTGDASAPIMNYRGRPYTFRDFDKAQRETDPFLEHNGYFAKLSHMELLEAHAIMIDILNSFKGDPLGASNFMNRVTNFVRSEEIRRPELHRSLQNLRQQWWKDKVETGNSFPKSWLFPRDPSIFDRISDGARECKKAYEAHMSAIAQDPNVQKRAQERAVHRFKL